MIEAAQIKLFNEKIREKIFHQPLPWSKLILLNSNQQPTEKIKDKIINHPAIIELKNLLSDKNLGIASFKYKPADFRIYRSFYWILRFFADLGLTADELGIADLIYQLLLQQNEEGQFILQYHQKKQHGIQLICMTAQISDCLIRLGYQNSPSVAASLNYILTTQRIDGGWHCDLQKQTGEKNQLFPSCLSANIFVIRVLGHFREKFKHIASPAIGQILKNWIKCPFNNCPYHTGDDINFKKLRYPPHFSGMDLLHVIDSLSLFPDLVRSTSFESLIDTVLLRWNGEDFLQSEKRIPGWSSYDFSHNHKSSPWISALFLRALSRVYGF